MHSGPACVLALLLFFFHFPAFTLPNPFYFSSFPSFVDSWVSAREFEREDRRIQDAWMRKVMWREPVPCDSFMNHINGEEAPLNGRRLGRRPVLFVILNHVSRFVKFTWFVQMREPSRKRVEGILRVTLTPRKIAKHAPNLAGPTLWASRESIHLASENNARTRQFESLGTEDSCLYSNSIECL